MKGFCKKGRFEMVNQYIHACYRLRLFDFNLKETMDEFINVIKIPIRILGGTLGLSMLPLAFGLSLIAIGGVCLAKPIVLSMNERTFAILELGVVAFAGTRLCYLGLVG